MRSSSPIRSLTARIRPSSSASGKDRNGSKASGRAWTGDAVGVDMVADFLWKIVMAESLAWQLPDREVEVEGRLSHDGVDEVPLPVLYVRPPSGRNRPS